jgi:hypothetical protein
VRYALRLCARNIAMLRTHMRIARLERSLALETHTPAATSKPNALRDVLAGITSAVPARPAGWWVVQKESRKSTNELLETEIVQNSQALAREQPAPHPG